jgi:hypothetical protein
MTLSGGVGLFFTYADDTAEGVNNPVTLNSSDGNSGAYIQKSTLLEYVGNHVVLGLKMSASATVYSTVTDGTLSLEHFASNTNPTYDLVSSGTVSTPAASEIALPVDGFDDRDADADIVSMYAMDVAPQQDITLDLTEFQLYLMPASARGWLTKGAFTPAPPEADLPPVVPCFWGPTVLATETCGSDSIVDRGVWSVVQYDHHADNVYNGSLWLTAESDIPTLNLDILGKKLPDSLELYSVAIIDWRLYMQPSQYNSSGATGTVGIIVRSYELDTGAEVASYDLGSVAYSYDDDADSGVEITGGPTLSSDYAWLAELAVNVSGTDDFIGNSYAPVINGRSVTVHAVDGEDAEDVVVPAQAYIPYLGIGSFSSLLYSMPIPEGALVASGEHTVSVTVDAVDYDVLFYTPD